MPPSLLAWVLFRTMKKMTEIGVDLTLVSVAGRILEFKYFSFLNRQPSRKCFVLKSGWSYKDYFNCILSHVGDILTLKSASAVSFLSCVNNDVGTERSPS